MLSNADQHLVGAEIALENAGYNVPDLYLSGGGAANIAIQAIREGRWDVDTRLFPRHHGQARAEDSDRADSRARTSHTVINMDEEGPVPALITNAQCSRRIPTSWASGQQ